MEQDDELEIGGAVHELIGEGDYPVMQLLWNYIEANDLWADFAAWASTAVENDSLTGTPDND